MIAIGAIPGTLFAESQALKLPVGKAWVRSLPDGWPDITGCVNGRFVGMEVKTPTGRSRPNQLAFARAITAVGGVYVIVRSPEEAIEQLRLLL